MENTRKKMTITPPGGSLIARYTVRCKPLDAFKKQLYTAVIPKALWAAVKGFAWYWILQGIRYGIAWILNQLLDLHDRIDQVVNVISEKFTAFSWLFTLLFWLYAVYLIVRVAIDGIQSYTGAEKRAESSLPEEYAFYGEGILYSNGKDFIRIPWKEVRLLTYSPLGAVIRAGGLCDTLLIPPRYFCSEFPAVKALWKENLGIRFLCLKKEHRDHEPMYPNPEEEPITQEMPTGDVIAEMTVALRFSDRGDLYAMWCRQIAGKHNRGVFGIICLFLLAAVLMVASFVMKEQILLVVAGIALALMVFYAVAVSLWGMVRGRYVLVNRRTYRKPVKYRFYPDGFLMIYENGISYVQYEDLELIFEDREGLGFFFSKKQCLFIPSRVMHSKEGNRLSHYYKASLFNLDPTRENRRIIEDGK